MKKLFYILYLFIYSTAFSFDFKLENQFQIQEIDRSGSSFIVVDNKNIFFSSNSKLFKYDIVQSKTDIVYDFSNERIYKQKIKNGELLIITVGNAFEFSNIYLIKISGYQSYKLTDQIKQKLNKEKYLITNAFFGSKNNELILECKDKNNTSVIKNISFSIDNDNYYEINSLNQSFIISLFSEPLKILYMTSTDFPKLTIFQNNDTIVIENEQYYLKSVFIKENFIILFWYQGAMLIDLKNNKKKYLNIMDRLNIIDAFTDHSNTNLYTLVSDDMHNTFIHI